MVSQCVRLGTRLQACQLTEVRTFWLGMDMDSLRILQVVLLWGGIPLGRLGRLVTDCRAFPVLWELAAGVSYPCPYLPKGKAGLGLRNLLVWFGSSLPGSQGRMETRGWGGGRKEEGGRGNGGDGGRVSREGDEESCEGKAGD